MSRHLRKQGIWPGDALARVIWQLAGALEDAADLFDASKRAESDESSLALMKKALAEFCSFDDIVGQLRSVVREVGNDKLADDLCQEILKGLRAYDVEVEPSRKLLRDIRNTIGAHRTGFPGAREAKRFGQDFSVWGAWEQHLGELENHCKRERWVEVLNAGITLRNLVTDTGVGHWYSTSGDIITLHVPIRLA